MMRWKLLPRIPNCAARAREALRAAPDIARALARLSVARGGPRDLANLRDGVKAARALRDSLRKDDAGGRGG